jgi:hypothetical protein
VLAILTKDNAITVCRRLATFASTLRRIYSLIGIGAIALLEIKEAMSISLYNIQGSGFGVLALIAESQAAV